MSKDLFFEVLRYSVGVSDELPVGISSGNWEQIYETARQQSLLGIVFYGIQRSSSEKPDRKLLLQWFSVCERIRQANQKTNFAAVRLAKFFREQGFRTCILKGQGNSLYYPDPYIRTSGDIDIWVEGGTRKVLDLARRYVADAKSCYHHIEFRKVDGVETEVHYRPSFMNNMLHNRRLQRWFKNMADEQFSHEVGLPDGAGKVCVPTAGFNRIYQMSHISNHFFHEGIGLRQIVDYYFVLQQGFTEEERRKEELLLRKFGLYRMAAAVMYVLKDTLHLDDRLLLVPADERRGKFLLNEILLSGNFGQYDKRVRYGGSQLTHNIQRLRRDFRLMWYFPSECLWEPVFRIYHFFWRLYYQHCAT